MYLEKICKEIGLDVDIFTPESVEGLVDTEDYKAGRQADKRNNLVAILKGEEDKNGVMLTVHMDTMPAGDLSKWDDDPFSGLIKDGKIYGRGVGDDKFGLIIAWFLMKAFSECGVKLKKNLLLGSYCDEEGGEKKGNVSFAIYTDKTKEETKAELAEIFEKIKPVLLEQNLASDGFILTTRFFRYGKTEESKEAALLADCIKELTGEYPDPKGTCLSDLLMFLYYSTKNSLNYGIPRGDEKGGGAHQPNEYIECKNMVECMKTVALTLLRM